mmetsp:Transcript_10983/g.27685  ORF Transcript_10983/g.27685 Transcript_10983/m.27685 type:complete len:214 (-) Transcript_10983:48-689(-)
MVYIDPGCKPLTLNRCFTPLGARQYSRRGSAPGRSTSWTCSKKSGGPADDRGRDLEGHDGLMEALATAGLEVLHSVGRWEQVDSEHLLDLRGVPKLYVVHRALHPGRQSGSPLRQGVGRGADQVHQGDLGWKRAQASSSEALAQFTVDLAHVRVVQLWRSPPLSARKVINLDDILNALRVRLLLGDFYHVNLERLWRHISLWRCTQQSGCPAK